MLTVATSASANPMGAERYQREVLAGARAALPGTAVRHLEFRSLRSPLAGDRRLPMGWLRDASAASRSILGRVVFAGAGLVHRMDLLLPPGPNEVVTLHDVVAWLYPDESSPVRAAAAELKRAAAVICVSQYSAEQAVERLGVPDPVVVYNGVDERFFSAPELSEAQRRELGLVGDYVLHAGGAAKRKNLEGLAQAWPLVHRNRPQLTLALCGPEHERRTRLFTGMPGVRLLGRQPEELLPSLVKSASAVVVPSWHEGFGLPALEAMAAGVPVVAANTSSLPEVVGECGILVEPQAGAIAEGLLVAAAGRAGLPELVVAGAARAREFTWQRCLAGHAEVWQRLGVAG
ncbi:MAG TPA: glycosyltransferase family 1 protein [Propionicimonas sp.]|nr:glycosyltransferase family 1 protein [Propionicimonas sp.]HQA77330.1 glycosyltransferase family 1 protein [Propionicimonas sp.]HQD97501.1 glycosyltransferase family 1 protein [Propionicimonas sp.]